MAPSTYLPAIWIFGSLVTSIPAQSQEEIANPQAIASAKTIYFDDRSGVDAVGKKALAELRKWGRFEIVQDKKKADLILMLERDPHQGGQLIFSGGQTGTIDSQGRIAEDPVPNYNKQTPTSYAFLTVVDAKTGSSLWSDSQRWGGLLTGFDSVGEHLVKNFEKQTRAVERTSSLKLVKSVEPTYPALALQKRIGGTVTVRIVVDKNGTVSDARPLVALANCFRPPWKQRGSINSSRRRTHR